MLCKRGRAGDRQGGWITAGVITGKHRGRLACCLLPLALPSNRIDDGEWRQLHQNQWQGNVE